jgi:hypothetical protein
MSLGVGRVHPQAEALLAGSSYYRAVTSSGATPGERASGWMRSHELTVDCVAALVIIACCVSFGLLIRAGGGYLLLSVLLAGPLAVRRQRPVLCLVAVLVVALVQWLTRARGVPISPDEAVRLTRSALAETSSGSLRAVIGQRFPLDAAAQCSVSFARLQSYYPRGPCCPDL